MCKCSSFRHHPASHLGAHFSNGIVSLLVVDPVPADTPWIEPYPDALLEAMGEARFGIKGSMTLAFVAALQRLAPDERSLITLHDLVGFSEPDVADMLDIAEGDVHGALQLARASLDASLARSASGRPAPSPHSASERRVVERFARAFERGDVKRLAALLTHDARLTTPPEPLEYRGREAITAFLRERCDHRAGRRCRLVATRANTQPAFGCYLEDPHAPIAHAHGLIVLTLQGDRISALTRFLDTSLNPVFGLPRTLSTNKEGT
jgi:RNA polymerase sigma-70 factor, ECF subfamily